MPLLLSSRRRDISMSRQDVACAADLATRRDIPEPLRGLCQMMSRNCLGNVYDCQTSHEQLVPAAVHRHDETRLVGASLELRAELGDVVVDGPSDRELVIAPNIAQELLATDHFVAVRQ